MEQFGMMEKRTANNSLNYFNMDPMKSLERRRQIRNISFDVEISDSEIIITIGTSIIFTFVISMLFIFLPFIFLPFTEALIPLAGGVALYFLSYLMRLHILLHFKTEVKDIIEGLE